MKYTESVVRKLLLPGLMAISIPLVAIAEPELEGGGEHFAMQQQMHSGKHFGQEGKGFHFPEGMELSETQRDKIFAIKHSQEALLYDQGKIVRKAHMDLHKLAKSDQYDDEKAKVITDKLGKALANVIFLRTQEKHQIFALLTPEQRNLLNSHPHGHSAEHPTHTDGGKPGAPSRP